MTKMDMFGAETEIGAGKLTGDTLAPLNVVTVSVYNVGDVTLGFDKEGRLFLTVEDFTVVDEKVNVHEISRILNEKVSPGNIDWVDEMISKLIQTRAGVLASLIKEIVTEKDFNIKLRRVSEELSRLGNSAALALTGFVDKGLLSSIAGSSYELSPGSNSIVAFSVIEDHPEEDLGKEYSTIKITFVAPERNTGYLGLFRGRSFQLSWSPEGVGRHGTSPNVNYLQTYFRIFSKADETISRLFFYGVVHQALADANISYSSIEAHKDDINKFYDAILSHM